MSNILITGTSSGIGLATAVELARRGERVFASMRDLSRSGPLEQAASEAGVRVDLVQLDVTDTGSVERAVGEVVAEGGSIDVVVNNAGIAFGGPLEFATDDDIRSIFETNVFGPLRLIRAALPHMRAQRSGRIINVSSGAADPKVGIRLIGLYAATKAALGCLTLELAKEVAPLGIRAVLMERGIGGATPMMARMREANASRTPQNSPYEKAEAILAREFSIEMPDPAISAGRIADACTMPDPPVRYPADMHKQFELASLAVDDERFLRLARFESDEELFEGLGGFWQLQKAIFDAEPVAPT